MTLANTEAHDGARKNGEDADVPRDDERAHEREDLLGGERRREDRLTEEREGDCE